MTAERILGLTLYEPWASLMAMGHKTIETRSWATPYRGLVLIHAGKRWTREEQEYAEASYPCANLLPFEWTPKLGYALAVGELTACKQMTEPGCQARKKHAEEHVEYDCENLDQASLDYLLGYWEPGRYAWIFRNVQRIEPFAVRGSQGVWPLPPDVMERVRTALEMRP